MNQNKWLSVGKFKIWNVFRELIWNCVAAKSVTLVSISKMTPLHTQWIWFVIKIVWFIFYWKYVKLCAWVFVCDTMIQRSNESCTMQFQFTLFFPLFIAHYVNEFRAHCSTYLSRNGLFNRGFWSVFSFHFDLASKCFFCSSIVFWAIQYTIPVFHFENDV